MRARAQGKAPARAAFAGKVSECVCVRAQGTCTCSLLRRRVASRGLPRACLRLRLQQSLCNDLAACRGAGPSGVDRGSDTEPSLRPLVVLEPRNHELDIRLKPVGFLLVEIHRRFIKVGRLHGRFELGEPMLLKRVVDLANFTRQLWNVPLCTRCRCTRCRTATQGH